MAELTEVVPTARRTVDRQGRATKGDRREQAILDAMEGLLTESPFAKLSVGRIAERAGVGRTAFYFYFASRESALAALAERSVAPIYVTGEDWLFGDGEPLSALSDALRGAVDLWCAQTHLLRALVDASAHEPAMLALWRDQVEAMIEVIAARIERDARRGLTRPGLQATQAARALAWMTERLCYMQLGDRPWRQAPEEVHAALVQIWQQAVYRA